MDSLCSSGIPTINIVYHKRKMKCSGFNNILQNLSLMLCYAKSLQSCPTLCDPIDGSPPGSPVHGILQARTLEWVAISSSSAWKWKVKVKSLSHVRLLVTPWTAAHQAPPSMGFARQEYWSGVPLPSPRPCRLRVFKIKVMLRIDKHSDDSYVHVLLLPAPYSHTHMTNRFIQDSSLLRQAWL